MYLFFFLEPLSKLLKNAKQNAANTDGTKVNDNQKWWTVKDLEVRKQNYLTKLFLKPFPVQRTSLGATLLSPVSQLALGTIGRSRSLINQSQESLDPGDHYNHSDREEEPHQQDADDEDDSGLVSCTMSDMLYRYL